MRGGFEHLQPSLAALALQPCTPDAFPGSELIKRLRKLAGGVTGAGTGAGGLLRLELSAQWGDKQLGTLVGSVGWGGGAFGGLVWRVMVGVGVGGPFTDWEL